MTKITKATFKSFLRKNEGNIFIRRTSDFDGMVDCVTQAKDPKFVPLTKKEQNTCGPEGAKFTYGCDENDLGFDGIWLVNGSRDRFSMFDETVDGVTYHGIRVYNCCGSFTIAVKV